LVECKGEDRDFFGDSSGARRFSSGGCTGICGVKREARNFQGQPLALAEEVGAAEGGGGGWCRDLGAAGSWTWLRESDGKVDFRSEGFGFGGVFSGWWGEFQMLGTFDEGVGVGAVLRN